MVLCSNIRTALIRLLSPEAPSACPMLGLSYIRPMKLSVAPWPMRNSPNCILVALTEPMYTPVSPKTFPTAVVSEDFDDKQIKKNYEV